MRRRRVAAADGGLAAHRKGSDDVHTMLNPPVIHTNRPRPLNYLSAGQVYSLILG